MAVVPMKKVLICGMKEDCDEILDLLQAQEVLEISREQPEEGVFLQPQTREERLRLEQQGAVLGQALEVLDRYVPEKKGLFSSLEGRKILGRQEYDGLYADCGDALEKAGRLVTCSENIGELKARIPVIEQQLEELSPWQSFDLPLSLTGTKKSAVFIGYVREEWNVEDGCRALLEAEPELETLSLTIIYASQDLTCLMAVCHAGERQKLERALQKAKFSRATVSKGVPSADREELERLLAATKRQITAQEDEIRDLANARERIKVALDDRLMKIGRLEETDKLVQSRSTFLLSGYTPAEKAPALEQLVTSRYLTVVDISDPGQTDDVPTLLANNAFSEPCESVVESYGLPSRGEGDPTMVVSLSYYIFFGMMLSDAGYGLLMVAGTIWALRKYPNMKPGTRKFLKLFRNCGFATIFWGLMFGSFFGDAVNVVATTFFNRPDISLEAIWFEPVDYPMKMLVFCLAVGIIHLFLGLGVKLKASIQGGHPEDGIYDVVFWYMLVGGAVVYLLSMEMITGMLSLTFTLPSTVGNAAALIAVLGAIGIILMAGRESKNWFKRILKGLYGVYGITSYLSDILSYSRLLALGLATSVISTVFNQMGSMAGGGILGAIVFILVFAVGHALNMGINALGAYVHSNRLEFVEFFGKFYEGGGRKFVPFAADTKYYKIKEDI